MGISRSLFKGLMLLKVNYPDAESGQVYTSAVPREVQLSLFRWRPKESGSRKAGISSGG